MGLGDGGRSSRVGAVVLKYGQNTLCAVIGSVGAGLDFQSSLLWKRARGAFEAKTKRSCAGPSCGRLVRCRRAACSVSSIDVWWPQGWAKLRACHVGEAFTDPSPSGRWFVSQTAATPTGSGSGIAALRTPSSQRSGSGDMATQKSRREAQDGRVAGRGREGVLEVQPYDVERGRTGSLVRRDGGASLSKGQHVERLARAGR